MQTSSQRRQKSLRRRHRIPLNDLCFGRAVDQDSPETGKDARANLKLASRIERAPRLLSARKDSRKMTSSIARPLTRRREETVRTTESTRDICFPLPPRRHLINREHRHFRWIGRAVRATSQNLKIVSIRPTEAIRCHAFFFFLNEQRRCRVFTNEKRRIRTSRGACSGP